MVSMTTSDYEDHIRSELLDQAASVTAVPDHAQAVRQRVSHRRRRRALALSASIAAAAVLMLASVATGALPNPWSSLEPIIDTVCDLISDDPRPPAEPPELLVGHWVLSQLPDEPQASPLVALYLTLDRAGQITLRIGGCGTLTGSFETSADLATRSTRGRRPIEGTINLEFQGPAPECTTSVVDDSLAPPSSRAILKTLQSTRTFVADGESLAFRDDSNAASATFHASRVGGPLPDSVRTPQASAGSAPSAVVPDILGLKPDEAIERILSAGFEVTQVEVTIKDSPSPEIKVVGVTPAVGNKPPPGESVQLFVRVGPLEPGARLNGAGSLPRGLARDL